MLKKILLFLYPLSIVFLFLYSLTQIDLNLFLFKFDSWVKFQRVFQNIGYFQRPLSAYIYILVLLLLFISYIGFLYLVRKNKIKEKEIWKLILFSAVLLIFSYNAFSYDLFNYIFDAKIITHYGQNPYLHKALDYQGDPMLNFMHWTHRTYPYGPSWLALTFPLSFMGFNFFLPTILMFKSLMSISFVGTVYFINKLLKKVDSKNSLFGTVFFALNPLIIIEGLVSAHLDIVMAFFGVLSFYLLFTNKKALSFLSLIFSGGIKFATGFLLPVFLLGIFRKDRIPFEKLSLLSVVLMILTVVISAFRTNYQPWYLLEVLPFAAFVSKRSFILIPSIIFSFASLLIYVPFLYTGNWNPPIPDILNYIIEAGILISFIMALLWPRMVKS